VQLFPALDIRGGRVARAAGSQDPLALLRAWRAAGATWVHLVDLDRAEGTGSNGDLIARLVREGKGKGKVQLGGGLIGDAVTAALEAGATRVIVGSAGVRGLRTLLTRHGAGRVGVSLDIRDGVAWTPLGTPVGDPATLFREAVAAGVRTVVIRDLARDGALVGTNFRGLALFRHPEVDLVLAGGTASLDDLAAARAAGVAGVIVGRALLDGRFGIVEALACCG
jgi:phosphoribosylformimino-5-aminoimidazole carboxamide ribonucleotide (ProFAR) isomerase